MIYLFFLLIGLQFHCYHFTRPHDVQEHKTGDDDWPKIIPYNDDFAFRLYKEMSSTLVDKNILFSPVRISTVYAMLSLGSTSTNRSQVYKGLAFNLSEIEENEIHKGFCQLIHKLNLPKERTRVEMGNALFIEKSLEVQPTFLEDVRNLYHAEHFFTDFLDSTKAEQQINNYVNNKAYEERVNTVRYLSVQTRMVLVNYFFFKGYWKYSFHSQSTSESDFLLYGNTSVKLNMMQKKARYGFLRDEDLSCSVVEMPYPDDVVVWFILPDKGKLKDVESSLVKEDLNKWRTSFEYSEIRLRIPKFSISVSSDITDLLQRLGVTSADLSRITRKHNLKVSQARHEAVLVVHEDQMAVASAYVPGAPRSVSYFGGELIGLLPPTSDPPPPIIEFNRPFLMVVIDTSTGTILLMGKIVDPAKEYVKSEDVNYSL